MLLNQIKKPFIVKSLWVKNIEVKCKDMIDDRCDGPGWFWLVALGVLQNTYNNSSTTSISQCLELFESPWSEKKKKNK